MSLANFNALKNLINEVEADVTKFYEKGNTSSR